MDVSENISLHDTNELVSSSKQIINKTILSENNYCAIVDKIVNRLNIAYYNKEKIEILNCLDKHNVTSQEMYNWLLNNQINSNSIILFGEFNYYGISVEHLNYIKRQH